VDSVTDLSWVFTERSPAITSIVTGNTDNKTVPMRYRN
jgi:hypothetical protein